MDIESIKKLVSSEAFGVCLKDRDGRVLYQSDTVVRVCGQQTGVVCDFGCMLLREQDDKAKNQIGTQYFQATKIKDETCNVVFIDDGEQLITILLALESKIKDDIAYFEKFGLTKRESEVIALVLEGKSNSQIVKDLGVTKSTLKTHLNRIYKKIPDHNLAFWRR